MNKIFKTILILTVRFLAICSLHNAKAQCKVDTSDPVKGEFSINGTKVQVNGDGGGVLTAPNNIPIKICEGELISLKNTLTVTSQVNVNYWIISLSNYQANVTPIQTQIASTTGSYSGINGSVDLKMIEKNSDPKGLSFYNGPGKYVIIQYDNSTTLSGAGLHHACQVIEVIKPTIPEATVTSCASKEFQIEFPKSIKNIFDDYEITFNAIAGNYNPILKTGKPQSYPFSIKSGSLLPDNQDRIITIKGLTVTGGCAAPLTNLGLVAVNITVKPLINSLTASIQKGEFRLLSEVPVSMPVNVYIRDPLLTDNYDYKNVFKSYLTRRNLGTDSVKLVVPNVDRQYCFTTGADDTFCPTNNFTTIFKSLQEVCTMKVNVEVNKGKNVITWSRDRSNSSESQFKSYRINRSRITGVRENLTFKISNIDTLKYTDSEITCNDEYIYGLVTLNNQASYSQNISVKADANYAPPKIPNVVASVVNNKYVIVKPIYNPSQSDLPKNIKIDNYKFYKANSLNDIYSLAYTGKVSFVDSTVEADKKSYCYYVTCTNICHVESEPSEKVCNINLRLNQGEIEWTKESTHSLPSQNYELVLIDTIKKVSSNFPLNIDIKSLNFKQTLNYYLNPGDVRILRIITLPQGWNSGNNYLPYSQSNQILINYPPLVNEQETPLSVNIYPNPSQAILSIELKNDKPEIVNWILHNQTGQLINQSNSDKPILNYQSQIDIKNLQKGTYLLKIESGEKFVIRKIIKD